MSNDVEPRVMVHGSALAGARKAQLSELAVRLHPPARVHRDGDGPQRWLPAAVLGKTANRRSTRPWASARHQLHQSTTAAGCHSARRSGVLNKHSWPTSSRSSSEHDRPLFTCPHRGRKLIEGEFRCCTCVIWTSREVAKSGTGTGGLNSNDSGSGACPLTARSFCQYPCRTKNRASEEGT